METSTSQLTSEQPAAATTKTSLEPAKKDIPSPKTKKKLQWDSRKGTIMIKSNPITPRWVIHKLEKNYIAEAFQKEWKFWALHQASQAECLAMERGALRESGFEGQWDLIARLRKRETPLLKVTHKVSYTSGTRGESSGFISAWAWVRPTCWYRRFSCKVGGAAGTAAAHCGDKDTGCRSSGVFLVAWALLEATVFSPRSDSSQQPISSNAGTPQAKHPTRAEA